MAKWKLAGQLAVAMREAERQAAEKRLREEQRTESIKNNTILRALRRSRDCAGRQARASNVNYKRWFQTLESETTDTEKDAAVAACTQYQREDAKNKAQVLDYINAMDTHHEEARKIQTAIEMTRIKEREADEEIDSVRRKLRLVHLEWERVRVPHHDRVLRRMQLAHEALGLQVAENRRLAERIQHLEGQMKHVTDIHSCLKKDLDDLSKQLGGHVEEAQSTYEQRDMNKRNMQKLKEHMSKSSTAHTNDMQNLQFKIDVLKRMEEFMTTKNKFRQDEGRERRKQNRRQLSSTEREAGMLSDLMRTIERDLDEPNVHVIVNTFVQMETENFMLFSNIFHVKEGIHQLQVQMEAMRDTVREMRIQKEMEKEESMARKAELLEKIGICREAAETKEAEVMEADDIIGTYMRAVTTMLTNMKYTPEDITRLAGVFRRIEERNIGTFLAEIERYINRLHCLHSIVEYNRWSKALRLSLTMGQMGQQTADALPPREPRPKRVVVVPPQIEHWDGLDDSDVQVCGSRTSEQSFSLRPLSLEEIRAQVEQNLKPSSSEVSITLE